MTTLTDDMLAGLEAKAKALNSVAPGPWTPSGDWTGRIRSHRGFVVANAHSDQAMEYLAAVSPDVVSALVAELRAARADNAALLDQMKATSERLRTFAHAEACAVSDEYDPDDTDGCVCVLSVLPALAPHGHPGAALLAEVERLRERVKAAHDEGMEEGALVADSYVVKDTGRDMLCNGNARGIATDIRARKSRP